LFKKEIKSDVPFKIKEEHLPINVQKDLQDITKILEEEDIEDEKVISK